MPCLDQTRRKTPIAVMLENYCRINVTTENVSKYICVCCKKNLQMIASKVDNFREKWMGKDNIKVYLFVHLFYLFISLFICLFILFIC